jgi:hypothetical protein
MLAAGAAAIALTAGAFAQKPGAGTAEGELKVGERTFPLRFAYALEIDDVEGQRPSGPQKSLQLQLTDTELPADAVGDWARCAELVRAGKLRAVEIRVDPAKKSMFAGTIYHQLHPEEPPTLSITTSGNSSTYQLSDLKIERDRVSGTALMPEPEKWVRFRDDGEPETFQYRVAFSAPIRRQPPVTAVLTGVKAQQSPQVKALLAFEAACRKGDLALARRLAGPGFAKGLDTALKEQSQPAVLKLFRTMMPDGKTRLRQVTRVIVRGDRATIVSRESKEITAWQKVIRKGTGWLVEAG